MTSIVGMVKHIGLYVVIGGFAAILMQWNIGRQAELSEKVGQFSQLVESQARETELAAQALEDQVKRAEQAEKAHAEAVGALKIRLDAQREAVQRAERMQSELARLRRENAELKEWADNVHPDIVRELLNAAARTGADSTQD